MGGAAPEATSSLQCANGTHTVQKLLYQVILSRNLLFFTGKVWCRQIWDLVESPMFQGAFTESLNSCFKLIFVALRRNVFLPHRTIVEEVDQQHQTMRTVALASLLPQVKAVALRLLPSSPVFPSSNSSNAVHDLSQEVREVASGPLLDQFCLSIFSSHEL